MRFAHLSSQLSFVNMNLYGDCHEVLPLHTCILLLLYNNAHNHGQSQKSYKKSRSQKVHKIIKLGLILKAGTRDDGVGHS